MHNEQLTKNNSSFIVRPSSLAMVIVLLAAFIRVYQLPVLPPGLNFDEAGNGVAALDILNGVPKLWWQIGGGKEPLWPYLIALATAALGNIPFALRFPASAVGILTVAAVYPLMAVLFRNRSGRFIALLTMLGLALSGWHVHFSRLGFRAILLPLFSTLAFYFFWRGFIRLRDIRSVVMAALFIALAIYGYLAGRLLPLVVILFLITEWLLFSLYRLNNSQFIIEIRRKLAIFFVSLLLFLTPLIIYFALNPADFVARTGAVSIFNPEWHDGDLLGTAWQTFILTLGTFLSLTGDANPLVNLPGQPALPIFLAPFFILGLGVSIYHAASRRQVAGAGSNSGPETLTLSSPHLFLVCWWLVMLLPALLAPEGAPHHLRLIGALVPTYALSAVGLVAATQWLCRFGPGHRASDKPAPYQFICFLLPAVCYLLLAVQTYTNYFIRWPDSTDFTLPFDLYATRLANDIAQTPPDVVYILPMDIRAADEARHYSLDYLLANRAVDSYAYIPVDERNAEMLLSRAATDAVELRVVRWTADKHREADAKELVTFLLEMNARPVGRQSFPVYDLETYRLPQSARFNLPPIDQPIHANFDNLLRLDAAFVPASVRAGGWLPVALTVAPLATTPVDYKASVRLVGPDGERVAQKDRTLMYNFHQGTSLWPPETVNEYYLLPVPPDAPPGEYTVTVVFYHPVTQAPLVADGLAEAPLGKVSIR